MSKKNKVLIISGLVIFLSFCFASKTFAVILTISTEKTVFHQQEEFAVDVMIIPKDQEDINAFDLTLSYSPNLTFIREGNGSSITGLWIQKPTGEGNSIHFAGIIPGGFTGLINPLDSNPLKNKKPGMLIQLIFSGNREGEAVLSFTNQEVTANDGLGTILGTSSNILTLAINSSVDKKNVEAKDDAIPPENFSIFISEDQNLFDGKYVLLFEAKDKDSGIDYYEIMEEGFNWKKAESPYVLLHQPPIGTILVKATDRSGNSTIKEITPNIETPSKISKTKLSIILIIVVIFVGLIVFLQRRRKKMIQ